MSYNAMAALPSFTIIRSAAMANQARRKQKAKPQIDKKRQRPAERHPITETRTTTTGSRTTNAGFGNKKKEPVWQCIEKCGACCKLDKGPSFPSAEEIFDDPADVEQYKRLIGPDGWCVHFDKPTRRCTIYAGGGRGDFDRPYFCRVEPEIFERLYGIEEKKFNKEACSCCIDTIKAVYGSKSEELNNFNHAIWNAPSQTN